MTRRVLVTGAAGFAGRYVCQTLLGHGDHVVALCRMHENAEAIQSLADEKLDNVPSSRANGARGRLETIVADVTQPGLQTAVSQAQPTHIIHLAGVASPASGDKLAFYAVNTLGTVRLLEAIEALPTPPKKTVLASSANVYGNLGLSILGEETCPKPVNNYGCSKLAMEHLAAQYSERLSVQCLRLFNFTGVGQSASFLVPKIVNSYARADDRLELGNTDVSRDFSDVRDVADDITALLDVPTCDTVNICSGRYTSLAQILDVCSELSGHTPEIAINPAFVRKNEIKKLRGSRERLESMIPSSTRRPFRSTLDWMMGAAINDLQSGSEN